MIFQWRKIRESKTLILVKVLSLSLLSIALTYAALQLSKDYFSSVAALGEFLKTTSVINVVAVVISTFLAKRFKVQVNPWITVTIVLLAFFHFFLVGQRLMMLDRFP